MTEKKFKGIKVAAVSVVMAVVGSGAALAATIPGHDYGEVLRGTNGADTIHGYGGGDTVWGGNEAGWGDKVLGGTAGDRLIGQKGHDALYGGSGSDRLDGQNGDDLLVGGTGEDTLNAGSGADEVDARDGRRDWIELMGSGPGDVVYYDRGLDVLVTSVEPAAEEGADVSAAEAARATGTELSAAKPPEGLFDHTGKVLVEHKGEGLLVAEKRVEGHMTHGDEILDPTGRAGEEGGRR